MASWETLYLILFYHCLGWSLVNKIASQDQQQEGAFPSLFGSGCNCVWSIINLDCWKTKNSNFRASFCGLETLYLILFYHCLGWSLVNKIASQHQQQEGAFPSLGTFFCAIPVPPLLFPKVLKFTKTQSLFTLLLSWSRIHPERIERRGTVTNER